MRHELWSDRDPAESQKEKRRRVFTLRQQKQKIAKALSQGKKPALGKLYKETLRELQVFCSALGVPLEAKNPKTKMAFHFSTWETLFWWSTGRFPQDVPEGFLLWEAVARMKGQTLRDYNYESNETEEELQQMAEQVREAIEAEERQQAGEDTVESETDELTEEQQQEYERMRAALVDAGFAPPDGGND